MPSLTINRAVLAGTSRDLGLTLPVWPKVERLRNRRRPNVFIGGRYDGIDPFGGGGHIVLVNPYQTPRAAAEALMHELVHAAQCERWGSWARFESEYERQLREAGIMLADDDYYVRYREIPFEAEAFQAQAAAPPDLILSDECGIVASA